MLKIKLYRAWWALLLAMLLSYPVATYAAETMQANGLVAPFLVSWLGVWVFAIAGGLGASFIYVTDVDSKLKNPVMAKLVLGTFWGVALCLFIDAMTSTPMGALPLFALAASCFSAPVCAGLMVYISNQKRLNGVFDLAKDTGTMRVFGKKAEGGKDEAD